MIYVLFEFAYPHMLFVYHAIAEIVTDNAVLSVLDKFSLSIFVKSVEYNHGERVLIFFLN